MAINRLLWVNFFHSLTAPVYKLMKMSIRLVSVAWLHPESN